METNDSRGNEFWIAVAQTGFQGMAVQKNDGERKENARPPERPGVTESFSRLIRLSLGRLLLSRACFRFTGQQSVSPVRPYATKISKPAKRASRVQAA